MNLRKHLVGIECWSALAVAIGCRSSKLDRMMRLETGDSVHVLAVGPINDPGAPPGLAIEYHPYVPIQDTTKLKVIAEGVVHELERKKLALPEWLVLRAASNVGQSHPWDTVFAVVIRRAPDGHWRFLPDGKAIE